MYKLAVFCLGLIFSVAVSADSLEDSRVKLQAKKKMLISEHLQLTKEESGPFWKVYDQYEAEISKAAKEGFDLIRNFNDGYKNDTISEQSASNMLAAHFRLEGRVLNIKQGYISRFKEILPTKKVFRFYQIDNKIDSHIRCDIAKKLPLIETEPSL